MFQASICTFNLLTNLKARYYTYSEFLEAGTKIWYYGYNKFLYYNVKKTLNVLHRYKRIKIDGYLL